MNDKAFPLSDLIWEQHRLLAGSLFNILFYFADLMGCSYTKITQLNTHQADLVGMVHTRDGHVDAGNAE